MLSAALSPTALASFNENFDLHEQWRRAYAARLQALGQSDGGVCCRVFTR